MAADEQKVGLWLIGACGGVAATTCLGLAALARKLTTELGLVTELPLFKPLDLVDFKNVVVGGHEIRDTTIYDTVKEMQADARLFTPELLKKTKPVLQRFQRNVRTGTALNAGKTIRAMAAPGVDRRDRSPAAVVKRLGNDINDFKRRHRLRHVVVINVASTEPPFKPNKAHASWAFLDKAMRRSSPKVLPASSLYAAAAVGAGHSYVNFTPSGGIDLPAIRQLADRKDALYMGSDGKTGETLMKSALAPMFAARNLHVLSWVGHNIFGNRDGLVLADPANKAAKVQSKDHLIGTILGYEPQTHVSIEYIRSLGDWKTAWNHIDFQGFLGTKMNLQFIWQGCDSVLAAPLVIDLLRLTEFAHRRGEKGTMHHLACFFKSPMDVAEQDFFKQVDLLRRYVESATADTRKSKKAKSR